MSENDTIKEKLSKISCGDLVKISLKPEFCNFAKTQPRTRFSSEELDTRTIRGIVFYSSIRSDVGFNVVDLHSTMTENGTVLAKSISILEDEIEDVVKYE